VQIVALAMVAVGLLGATQRPEIGGAVVVLGALLLGILAAFQYAPLVALIAFLAFFVPGAALVGSGVRSPAGLVGAVFAGVLILAAGGVTAASAHRYLLGPTHPQSTLHVPGTDEVEWAWAGATTTTGFTVTANLDDPAEEVFLDVDRVDGAHGAFVEGEASGDDERTVSFTVDGLAPDTAYRYAVVADGEEDSARTGVVRTFPAGAASFSFALSSCARIGSNGAVFDAVREERPLVFLATGDLFYGNVSENDPGAFRHFYDRLLGQPAPSALFRTTSVAYVWDDHDFGPDGADRTSASAPAAKSVYRERVPHYALPSSAGAIFQRFDIGRVRFLLTDTRSQRDPSYERDSPGKTMLGDEQRAWLERELVRARDEAALTVWVSSVPWIGDAEPGSDTWAGYAHERRELAGFLERNGITRLLMLSGDAHMLAIDTGAHSGYTRGGGRGFPVFHAAPLDKRPGVKGGPYSLGPVLESGQFGVVTVTDRGSELRVRLSGRDHEGDEVLRYAFSVPAGP
jgi:PhoD-like phosphatase